MPQPSARGPAKSGGGARLGDYTARTVKDRDRVIRTLTADLREQRRQEQQLRRYMEYLAVGEQITRTGSWAWNCSSGELFWSREHFRIFGLDPARTNTSCQLFSQMVHPEDRSSLESAFLEAVRAERDFDREYRIIRPDGVVAQIHSRAHPVFDKPDKLTEYVGTAVDVTELRRGEESLGRMLAELARASRAVTLGQLMASIAHEVNQPLAAVVANANAALRWLAWTEPQINRARQSLARIVRDGNRASEVITRIRDLIKKSDARRTLLNFNSLVLEVLGLLKAELRRNGISVRTQFAERLPSIRGDRVQLQQVVLNLILNAIEAMASVYKRPRLLVIATTADSSDVAVAVEDCGVGIAERLLNRIFEPFFSNKPKGMGIGLSISRSIVEAHGGLLWAECNVGPGATFQLRLPCARLGAK
jgi:signal transduction histidine kinase